MSRVLILPALLALALLPGAVKAGPTELPREVKKVAPEQFYGPWKELKNYWHREYYFKVQPTDREYQKHEVIFYKTGPHFFYYYNPESGQFWGRGAYDCHGNEQYQFLQPDERAGNLKDVNFDAKAPGPTPNLGTVNPPAGDKAAPPAPVADKTVGGPPDKTLAKGAGPRLKLPPDEPPPEPAFGG